MLASTNHEEGGNSLLRKKIDLKNKAIEKYSIAIILYRSSSCKNIKSKTNIDYSYNEKQIEHGHVWSIANWYFWDVGVE